MICPKCSSDYLDGVQVCVACHVLLVSDASSKPIKGNGHLVHFITYLSRNEAESARNLLECHGIEAIVSMDELRGVRLWIHKTDAPRVIKIFQENTLTENKLQKTH